MTSSFAPRLNAGFKSAQFVVQTHWAEVNEDLPFEEVLKPDYWAHVAQYMKRGDEIIVHARDLSYKARLTVMNVGHLFADVALEYKTRLVAEQQDAASLTIDSVGGKFRVLRGKDVLIGDLATKKEAQRWIEDNTRKAA